MISESCTPDKFISSQRLLDFILTATQFISDAILAISFPEMSLSYRNKVLRIIVANSKFSCRKLLCA